MISFSVGRGTGPETCAPEAFAVSTMRSAALSTREWSYPFKRMRMLPLLAIRSSPFFLAGFFPPTPPGVSRSSGKKTGSTICPGNLAQARVVRPVYKSDILRGNFQANSHKRIALPPPASTHTAPPAPWPDAQRVLYHNTFRHVKRNLKFFSFF